MFKRILKILMILFNIAVFFAGVASLVIGVWVIHKKIVYGRVEDSKEPSQQLSFLTTSGCLLVAAGAIITFTGFLGCYGGYSENQRMLMTFFNINLIAFVVEVHAAGYVLYKLPKVENMLIRIRMRATRTIQNGYGKKVIITNTWNKAMDVLKCCGYNNYTDFTDSPYVNKTSQYPKFCCSSGSAQCDLKKAESQKVNGCINVVKKWVKNHSALLWRIAICVAAVEVSAMIVSFIFIKKEYFKPAYASCVMSLCKQT